MRGTTALQLDKGGLLLLSPPVSICVPSTEVEPAYICANIDKSADNAMPRGWCLMEAACLQAALEVCENKLRVVNQDNVRLAAELRAMHAQVCYLWPGDV